MALAVWFASRGGGKPEHDRKVVVAASRMRSGPVTIMNDSNNTSDSFSLARLGHHPDAEGTRIQTSTQDDADPLRVVRVDAEGCTLWGAEGIVHAHVPKRVRRRSPPVVGDWVRTRKQRGALSVRSVLPRSTSLTRRAADTTHRGQVLAANVDLVLVCMGLDRDFRLARLERWLSLVHGGGARPIVVLTKAGLVPEAEREARLAATQAIARDVSVVVVDVLDGIGCDQLDEVLDHDADGSPTLVLVGSSGVGKSTLLNHLCGGETMPTRATSHAHGKGRHTTSHRELFEVPGRRLLIIDTPGLREVGLWGDAQGVEQTFADLVELGAGCRFSDCQHRTEPGCAVTAAIERSEVDPRRAQSWLGLREEQRGTAHQLEEHERRAHERKFAKLIRATMRAKQGRR